ncbi:pyridine nucleotide-disulfide oxidoreductase [Sinimarinibacterium sp. CAU 1509]|uniref:NAD(P)/FAD-dependent oxidoreductase n=1 Tax=Sinimarinibacterium sp. CAU 1509 TaxID=2562283 RepID=UPI0010ABF75D|nr:FAD-dependent oxidoreductase [Sinimarinibacterium sp. CAU 1509]TJY58360.1 pyridine nucleotide-disulfide oxidoreductase [Sinimarinibacterium sp. CAU 1509]
MNSEISTCVIVGAGQAGCELATALRQQGFEGRIVMIGDEPYLPYRRPPLSKTYLSGEAKLESLFIKPQSTYDKLNVECRIGVTVQAIDRAAHTVSLSDGETLTYTKLALTTGGRARRLSLAGGDAANVHYVRSIADIERLQADFVAGKRLVIIGGGYIGLEAAAVGIKKELKVSVIEALPRVLARVTAPEVSAFYERVHREHGVDLRTGVGVEALETQGDRVTAVKLADGTAVPADLVIVGIGLIPGTELAEAAGLEVSNGIVVDAHTQTSDPDILAAGDCTFHDNDFFGRKVRLESVPNAMEQARVAAATICGKDVRYAAVPWFWSDQYDLKLQMVGLNQGYDQIVVRGDMASNSFCAFYLQNGVVIAADAVTRPQDFMVAKKLVAGRVAADAAKLADETVELKSLLPAA